MGTKRVHRILSHPRLKRVELFWLCTRRPGFYAKLGFSAKEQTGMVWTRSRQARQEGVSKRCAQSSTLRAQRHCTLKEQLYTEQESKRRRVPVIDLRIGDG